MKKFCLYILSIILISASCVDEDSSNTVSPAKRDVLFTVNMPASTKAIPSYALTEVDENQVEVIDVLAFKVDENDNTKEYFAYKTQVNTIQDDGSSDKKKFSATLLKGGASKYRFVVLANARDQVNSLGDIPTSATKEELLARLIVERSDKWVSNINDNNYVAIPMWCETDQMKVDDNTQSIVGLNLVRMLARIDVLIDSPTQSIFQLKSVRLYNYKTKGRIVPLTDAAHWDGTNVLLPSVPDPLANQLGPLVYTTQGVGDTSITRDIYAFESAAVPADQRENATCLVVGGIYNNESVETFYRIDFANIEAGGNITYSSLLRNYLYNVKITKVEGSGHLTPDEAFRAISTNLTVEVKPWDLGGLSDIVIDGEYKLRVSQSSFTLPQNQITGAVDDNQLKLVTDYPLGWSIEKIVDVNNNSANASWLTVSKNAGASYVETTLNILTTENNTGADRTAYIHIKAGRLVYVITVTQTIAPELGLVLQNASGTPINNLLFYSYLGSTVPVQQLAVEWVPKNADLLVELTPVAGVNNFDFGLGDKIVSGNITGANGSKVYNIQPPALTLAEVTADPFVEKAYRVDFTVDNGQSYLSKVLFLFQKNYAALPTIDANFVMDGSQQYFTIKANAQWKIEVTRDPLNAIQELVTTQGGQNADKSDEFVYFKTNDYTSNPSITEADVVFTIRSRNPLNPYPSEEVAIKLYSGQKLSLSNSYILPPSSSLNRSYLIPVSRANEAVAGSISADDKLSSELVWTDSSNGLNSNGTLSSVVPVGRGAAGYIYVRPGTTSGNAVAAVKVGNTIKWSWHLWTTDYNPETQNGTIGSTVVMDRNLGALSTATNTTNGLGLLYQWGRKDPFVNANSALEGTTSTPLTVYDADRNVKIMGSTSSSTLSASIENPYSYVVNSSWSGSKGDDSWGGVSATKSVFDPCPPGWKVPQSNFFINNSFDTNNFSVEQNGRRLNGLFFPASGYRSIFTVSINNVGKGYYWSSVIGGANALQLYFNRDIFPFISSDDVIKNLAKERSEGMSIRCIKE